MMDLQISLIFNIALGSIPLFIPTVMLLMRFTYFLRKIEDIDKRMMRAGFRIKSLEDTQRSHSKKIEDMNKKVDILNEESQFNKAKDIYKKNT